MPVGEMRTVSGGPLFPVKQYCEHMYSHTLTKIQRVGVLYLCTYDDSRMNKTDIFFEFF